MERVNFKPVFLRKSWTECRQESFCRRFVRVGTVVGGVAIVALVLGAGSMAELSPLRVHYTARVGVWRGP